ncbi:hypothetical protein GCM10018962_60980 [Dactylosporangium matsuzakiense]|uniref:Uncharacterized protein n=1 Tax=Dactylosporangium matsuzakiense TaxID=53360 RepID=A0A9W6NTJ7_9ACTN|nr:hypothetical protein GCM10017581_105810 [Dactylosporangium matsuzakiense]
MPTPVATVPGKRSAAQITGEFSERCFPASFPGRIAQRTGRGNRLSRPVPAVADADAVRRRYGMECSNNYCELSGWECPARPARVPGRLFPGGGR